MMNNQATPVIDPGAAKAGDIILRTTALTKRFGALVAVKDLNIEIRRGEIFGFLGPNGAGKSTTVGMILGLIAPTSGKIELFGQDIKSNLWRALRRVGAVIEEPAFYPYLSGWNNLKALSISIGNIPDTKITEVMERVNLLDRAKDHYSTYSMGMKQRLGIASTLLRDPELIILDEPTNGLDPAGTKEIRDLIPQLAHESRAVVLCSHILHEVELVCTRVAIIKQGITLIDAPIHELLNRGHLLQIKVDEPAKAAQLLSGIPWIKSTRIQDGYLIIEAPQENASQITRVLAEHGIYLSELVERGTSLESVFLQLTGGVSDE
jgi:ABC-2 type transport system ATP-binding protein